MPARRCTAGPRSSWPGSLPTRATVGGQLARRDQLRGLLEAYRAKVDSLGLAEDPELEARFASARDLLSVAPCDIDAAQQEVQGYMDAARAAGPAHGGGGVVNRCDRPGCDGEIIDGYCDVAGHRAPDSAPFTPSVPVSSDPSAIVSDPYAVSSPLVLPGMIAADGYCNVCGSAQPAAAPGPAGAADPSPPLPPGALAPTSPPPLFPHLPPPPPPPVPGALLAGTASSSTQGTSTVRRVGDGTSTGVGSTGRAVPANNRGHLGAGLVDMPSVPERDPQAAVLKDPQVAERKRFCGGCNHPVGRARGQRSARTEGFCPHCGAPYSFTPKLWPGDLVGGQYLVAGCLAHGGLGWVYLAHDKNVEDTLGGPQGLAGHRRRDGHGSGRRREAVPGRGEPRRTSSGSRTSSSTTARATSSWSMSAASRSATCGCGTVKKRRVDPLPVAQAIAYILEHPAGARLSAPTRPPLLRLQARQRHSDGRATQADRPGRRAAAGRRPERGSYGTIGYQAPEVAESGAEHRIRSVHRRADAGRARASNSAGYQDEKRYATSAPAGRGRTGCSSATSRFHRFLEKATAADPDGALPDADEMARPAATACCVRWWRPTGEAASGPQHAVHAELGAFPTAIRGRSSRLLRSTRRRGGRRPGHRGAPGTGPADRTPRVDATLDGAQFERGPIRHRGRRVRTAERELDSPEARASGWHAAWWYGVLRLAQGRPARARPSSPRWRASSRGAGAEAGPGDVPREPGGDRWRRLGPGGRVAPAQRGGPRLHGRRRDGAGIRQRRLRLGRVFLALGDRDGAVAALQRIPKSSSAYVTAQITCAGPLCRGRT